MATAIANGGRLTVISAQLLVVLAADLGTTDLSATGRVGWGRWVTPRTVPFLAIDLMGVDTDDSGPALGMFGRTASFHLEGWSASTSGTSPAASMIWSNVMASEVMAALENAHRETSGGLYNASTYNIRRLYITDYQHHETEIDGAPYPHWTAKLVIEYAVTVGL